MKDRLNKHQVLFIILISFWALIFPTYCLFYSLDEMDVFRSPHWENPPQEDLLVDVQEELIGPAWNFCAFIFSQEKKFIELFPDLSTPLFIERVSVLRC